MSKAQQAAEERYPHIEDLTFVTENAVKATLRQGFLEGWKAALPEEPVPAVIEAMAKGVFAANNNRDWSAEDWGADWLSEATREVWRTYARAAYAALRGAMQ